MSDNKPWPWPVGTPPMPEEIDVTAAYTTDIIGVVTTWNQDAGNTTDHFNVRQTALYIGLQCEELAEKLGACGLCDTGDLLDILGRELKRGMWDKAVSRANRKDLLDADADLMVVTIGSAISQGADFKGAMDEVLRSNDSKRDLEGNLNKDANGKIVKGPHYSPPDLTPYICKD